MPCAIPAVPRRQRCLAIAYLNYADSVQVPENLVYQQRAYQILFRVVDAGLRDPEVLVALAWQYWQNGSDTYAALANEALSNPDCEGFTRNNALFLLAVRELKAGQTATAEQHLRLALEIEPKTEYWRLVGHCRAIVGDHRNALTAYQNVTAVLPQRPDVHGSLAELSDKSGQWGLASRHRNLSERFGQLLFEDAKRRRGQSQSKSATENR